MKKIIKYILWIIISLWIIWWLWYYIYNNIIIIPWEIKEGTEVQAISTESIDVESQAVLLEQEIQKKVQFLNKTLLTNYLKIIDYKQQPNLWTYNDNWVEFFQFKIDYDFNDNALADFDVRIDKWSLNEEDFKKKSDLYKEQVKTRMQNFFTIYWYDRLKEIGIVWYIKKMDSNNYWLFHLWEYMYDTYSNDKLNPELLGKLQILQDYFNYEPIFFNKEPMDIYKILEDVEKDLNNEQFSELAKILKALFFYDIK